MITSNDHVLSEAPNRLGRLEPVPAAERNDHDALRQRIERDGYLYLSGHLDRNDVLEFRRHYFSAMRNTGLLDPAADPLLGVANKGDVDRDAVRRVLYDSIFPGAEYSRLVKQPKIESWFRWFFAADVDLLQRQIVRHTAPGEDIATHAHYDLMYLREGTDRVLSLWIPLGDCPVTRGGLIYLEKSHHWTIEYEKHAGRRRRRFFLNADVSKLADQHDSRWLIADYEAGDVVIHSAYMVHAALDNRDEDGIMRLSTDIRYQEASQPLDWRWKNNQSIDDWKLEQWETIADDSERARRKRILEEVYRSPSIAGKHRFASEEAAALDGEYEQFFREQYPHIAKTR